MNDTIDMLESLVRSPGWVCLSDIARREWAERERVGVKQVISKDGDDAVEKLRQIVAAREAVEWTLRLPSEELARLRRQEPSSPVGAAQIRRPVPELVTKQNRRGGL